MSPPKMLIMNTRKMDDRFVNIDGDDMTDDLTTTGYFLPDKVYHAYGGFQDESEALDLSSQDWTKITNGTSNLWTGTEADGLSLSSDVMTITNAGDYTGTLSMTITGGNNKDYFIRCYNNTQTAQMGYQIGCSGTGDGNYFNITLPLYLECNASDQLQMEMKSSDGTNATLKSAVFYIAYLHG